jgi:hypothetical protein
MQVNSGSSYFIRIRHRNALETWSALPVVMQQNTVYDFAIADSMAYGNNMIESYDHHGWIIYSGDISDSLNLGLGSCFQDGSIDSADYGVMEQAVSTIMIGYNCQDITGDGITEASDYMIMEEAVFAGRHSMIPNAIGITDFAQRQYHQHVYKCIFINSRLHFNINNLDMNLVCNVFDLSGKFLIRSTLENLAKEGESIMDGVYFIYIEN